jgi:hypothetical protein
LYGEFIEQRFDWAVRIFNRREGTGDRSQELQELQELQEFRSQESEVRSSVGKAQIHRIKSSIGAPG